MDSKIQNTYIAIHKEIKKNVATIKELLGEAEALTKIIQGISDDQRELREKLEKSLRAMHSTIETLIGQTSTLFDLYDKLAKTTMMQEASSV